MSVVPSESSYHPLKGHSQRRRGKWVSPGQSLMSTVGTSRGSSSGTRTRTWVAQGGSRHALKATVLASSRAALSSRDNPEEACDRWGSCSPQGGHSCAPLPGHFEEGIFIVTLVFVDRTRCWGRKWFCQATGNISFPNTKVRGGRGLKGQSHLCCQDT